MGSLTIGSVLIGSFIACSVEVTEMVIIVVGVGTTRGWRATLIGAGCGLAVLVALVGGLGQALSLVPIDPLRVAIGALLLTFGLQWLTSGVVGVAADGFRGGEEEEEAPSERRSEGGLDWTAWLLSFKGVTLEGLEVAFIVIAFGAGSRGGHGGYLDAFVGAAAAFLVVGAAGALSINRVKKVPGRALKFGVGGLISTFGTFWAMEGLGVRWPGERLSLAWLYALFLGFSLLLMLLSRRAIIGPAPYPSVIPDPGPEGPLGIAPASAESVRLFQRKRGLRPSGDVDEPTSAAIAAEASELHVPGNAWEAVGVDPTDREGLEAFQERYGLPATGELEATTRGALRALQVPGLLDPRDEEAIRHFQVSHQLDLTGRMDAPTRAAMKVVAALAEGADGEGGSKDGHNLLDAPRWLDPSEPDSVRALQRMLHLDADGVVGDETRGALKVLRLLDADASEPVRSANCGRRLPDPADADAVKELQQDYGLEADGAIGPRTREALRWEDEHVLSIDVSSPESVKSFQRRHDLEADGVVGPATQAAIRAVRATRRGGDVDTKDRYGRAMDHAAGFDIGLDPADPESVRGFQRRHGLRSDGIIGPATQAGLRAVRAEHHRPAPADRCSGKDGGGQ